VVVVANDGIVIASDSKQRAASNIGISDDRRAANKIVILNDRTAIATTGMGDMRITSGGKVLADFSSAELLDGIKHTLSPNASASSIEGLVIDKLKSSMNELSRYVANGAIRKQNAPDGDLVDFILAGYENGVPIVHKIRVECDWNTRKIVVPTVESRNPLPNRPFDSNVVFFGRNLNILNVASNPAGAERKAAAERYPGVIEAIDVFSRGRNVSSADGVDIAADLIRLESEFDPENVGPPISIVVLSLAHLPKISVMPK
jgi:hypothetical protein